MNSSPHLPTTTEPSGTVREPCVARRHTRRARAWTHGDLVALAQSYLDRWLPDQRASDAITVKFDCGYARRVGELFHDAQTRPTDEQLRPLYEQFALETRRQYDAMVEAGLRVEPWRSDGQPYAGSKDLTRRVLATGTVYVYLTAVGHGSAPSEGYHPMREPSGVTVGGVPFAHNDLFRAVHDVFGHVMLGCGFDPPGEFLATYCHQRMYSPEVHPALFSETIGQICWFFYGPHLRGRWGVQARPGDPSFIPPAQRPYPEQKLTVLPRRLLNEFNSRFEEVCA